MHGNKMEAKPNPRQIRLWMLTITWGVAVVCGVSLLTAHNSTPGVDQFSPAAWPNDVAIACTKGAPTFIVFIHPQCPCTSATMSELARLDADVDAELHPIFVLVCPKRFQSQWATSSLAKRCESIPDGRVIIDSDREMAKRFYATTSGYCLLYSASGRLLFQGGITTGRGHEGESLGRVALRQIFSGRPTSIDRMPVFGCELNQPSQVVSQLNCCRESLL